MIELRVLGSGSSGNCALVTSARARLLIDAGLSAKQIVLRLEAAGIDPGSLDGIVVTHEHGDHVRGLDVFCKKFGVPLFCTRLTLEALRYILKSPDEKCWKLIPGAGQFAVGDLEVTTFPVPHDAVDPIGMVVRAGGAALGVVSDVGFVTSVMRDHLADIDLLFLEANYDEQLLLQDTKRPWPTKQRISARHGHLSNTQVAECLVEIASARLQHVVLGHLSEDCNQPDLAASSARRALESAGFGAIAVICAERKAASACIQVRPPARPLPARERAEWVAALPDRPFAQAELW
ncbi:MBL fold metallo-hydrolase [soil metagenome]